MNTKEESMQSSMVAWMWKIDKDTSDLEICKLLNANAEFMRTLSWTHCSVNFFLVCNNK